MLLGVIVPGKSFAKFNLLQLYVWGALAGYSRSRRGSIVGRVIMDHAVFDGAEATHAALTKSARRAADGVAHVWGATGRVAHTEVVSALGSGCDGGIRQ